ncbi:MAG: Fe-S cluster assembly protein SufD [Planctomycetota bacterium]|nr:Fe-S cluster assembly protein SufD [Planctomycetota bacterium]MED5577718.1 Fe-S cluster assembly protein SufD [Planctomycetota bacterium]
MPEVESALPFTVDGFQQLLDRRGDPDWVVEARREAWAAFEAMEWPSRTSEEWMRTDLRLFHLDRFQLDAGEEPPETPPSVLNQGVDVGGQAVSWNGATHSEWVYEDLAAKGVVFCSLNRAVQEHSELVRPYLMNRAFESRYDRFAALHAAWWNSGSFLYVPRGVVVEQPLHLVSGLSGGADLGHTLVVLDEGAEATVLSESLSPEPKATGLHCGGVELLVGKGANLRFVNLQDWGTGVWHFAQQKALVDRDANLQWTVGALGAKLAKVNQHVELLGRRAECQVNGVMFTEGRQHLAYHTLQHHVSPDCHSDFLYKGALQDQSRIVWRGMIKVDPKAQKTDGYQRNDNLLLSDVARSDSIPGLEIEADDVRCTHGSTSGRVDEELIFYARCRGYTRKEAIRMIVAGFFQQVFDRIPIESVREALGESIARRVRDYE